MKRFNRYVIEEMQKYLTELNCARQKERIIEKLNAFLDGVKYALGYHNLIFQPKQTSTGKFVIIIFEYQDLKDDGETVKYLGIIYADNVSEAKEG